MQIFVIQYHVWMKKAVNKACKKGNAPDVRLHCHVFVMLRFTCLKLLAKSVMCPLSLRDNHKRMDCV